MGLRYFCNSFALAEKSNGLIYCAHVQRFIAPRFITVEHNEARLAGTLAFLDAGTNPARLRIYGGTRPATPATTPASAMLVEIRLTKPAGTIAGGLLTLTQQEDGLITSTGVATWARLVNGNEVTALDLDCSGTDGDGDVKLASTNLYLGGDARMVSAILG